MRKADKKELKVKKLVLSKETLRILSGENLQEVVGGLPPDSNATCAGTGGTTSCIHLCSNAGAC